MATSQVIQYLKEKFTQEELEAQLEEATKFLNGAFLTDGKITAKTQQAIVGFQLLGNAIADDLGISTEERNFHNSFQHAVNGLKEAIV